MQTKSKKRQAALARFKRNLEAYEAGEWEPSMKDLKRGTTLRDKIVACRKNIATLENDHE